ncbi:thioredoxin-like protein [Tricholoma matsutake]|nr:thioredoxin-like protein [Tricholoma matsutake 945]
MVLKIYRSATMACTHCVGIILHKKHIPFEVIEVDILKDENKSPKYMQKQPFGQIPYIDDDGFVLYESRAICRYLAMKYTNQSKVQTKTELRLKS